MPATHGQLVGNWSANSAAPSGREWLVVSMLACAPSTSGPRADRPSRENSAEPLLAAAADAGASLEVVQLDVTDRESVFNALDGVLARAGHIDVLVNNAATADAGPLEFATEAPIQAMFNTNTFGPLRLVQAVLPPCGREAPAASSTVQAGASHPRMGHRLLGLYSASKAALSGLTEEMAKELAPLGIEVVLIDGALRGHSQMVNQLQSSAAAPSGWGTPYRVAEQIWRLQWLHSKVLR